MFFQRGQITVLALLLALLGLTVGLSVAARSLSDLRQVAVVDQGTKALAGAEAGIQVGLNALSAGGTIQGCPAPAVPVAIPGTVNLTGISALSYTLCGNTNNYAIFAAVPADDVAQINISGSHSNVKGFVVLWKNPKASIEVVKVNNSGLPAPFGMTRYLYNSTSQDPTYLAKVSGNAFAPSVSASLCAGPSICGNTNKTTCGDSGFCNASCAGFYGEIPYAGQGGGDLYLRVKPIYADSDIAVCGQPAGGSGANLSLQYNQVTAIATTSAGVTKKVQTTQVSNYLPSVFDNVFYSQGSLSK